MTGREPQMPHSDGDPWVPALERALRGQGVTLVYQPVVDLKHGAVVGYEALSRFEEAEGIGVVAPSAWFEAARRLGVGAELEARVVVDALDARDRLPPNTFLTVNLSPWVVDTPPVRRVLEGPRGLHRLVLEIRDDPAIEGGAGLGETFASLRGRGAYLAVDDAGSGYDSLSHIQRLRPDFVKLDRELVAGIDHDEAKLALVEMLVRFAERVDAWLLAEGVETEGELVALSRLGVPLAQGYFLGRPAAHWGIVPSEVRQLLLRSAASTGQRETVEPFVEPWPFLEEGRELEGLQLVREALDAGSQVLATLPVLDHHHRPVSIYSIAEALPARPIARVKVTTLVTDAARRAMTRPLPRRFDPLVCVDDSGEYLGVVRVERLIEALTSALEGGEPGRAAA